MATHVEAPTSEPARERRAFWLAVVAVAAVLVLLYAAPRTMYEWVGAPTADRWAQQIRLPEASSREVYQCPARDKDIRSQPTARPAKEGKRAKPVAVSGATASPTPTCRQLTQVEKDFLDQTENWLIAVGNFHLEVARDLFKWQYYATLSGLVAGSLTAAALLVISIQGLPTATLWMKSVFVVCSATAAFWVAIPQVYRYAANQSASLKAYSLASHAIWQIRAVRAGSLDGDGKWTDGPRFVSALPKQLAEIGALSLSFDENKVKLPDLKQPGT